MEILNVIGVLLVNAGFILKKDKITVAVAGIVAGLAGMMPAVERR